MLLDGYLIWVWGQSLGVTGSKEEGGKNLESRALIYGLLGFFFSWTTVDTLFDVWKGKRKPHVFSLLTVAFILCYQKNYHDKKMTGMQSDVADKRKLISTKGLRLCTDTLIYHWFHAMWGFQLQICLLRNEKRGRKNFKVNMIIIEKSWQFVSKHTETAQIITITFTVIAVNDLTRLLTMRCARCLKYMVHVMWLLIGIN